MAPLQITDKPHVFEYGICFALFVGYIKVQYFTPRQTFASGPYAQSCA